MPDPHTVPEIPVEKTASDMTICATIESYVEEATLSMPGTIRCNCPNAVCNDGLCQGDCAG